MRVSTTQICSCHDDADATVAHIDALQIEYSPFFTDHETDDLITAARELGVTIIAYSPLGKGMLSGKYTSPADFAQGDIRTTIPRFSEENMPRNLAIVEAFQVLADRKGCSPAQLAIAWVMAQGAIPIPGTKTSARLEENCGAGAVQLDERELEELRKVIEQKRPVGDRYNAVALEMCGK